MRSICFLLFAICCLSFPVRATNAQKQLVYKIDVKTEIMPAIRRQVSQAFSEADSLGVDLILIHMNTYGGAVVDADSIRTTILRSSIPVYAFVDKNAASAGALIAIACDGIYMSSGSSIGAATVVNQTGEAMPDKYQSYMRSIMRATAEAHGKDTLITAAGDTVVNWVRNPKIAEAMVDEQIRVAGVSDSGKVLTFTPLEAIEHGFCEGMAESVEEVLEKLGVTDYELVEYRASWVEKIIGFLVHPAVSGLLIMAIVGGIYFEMQSPGIGFPLGVAILAAVLYFMPLYLEGLAEHWEILFFVFGIILIALEIFVIPGFGVAGIVGGLLVFFGLLLSLLNNVQFDFEGVKVARLGRALGSVLVGLSGGFFLSIYLGQKLFTTEKGAFRNLALRAEQTTEDGFVGVDPKLLSLKGHTGKAHTVLRPAGKIWVDGKIYDAVAEFGFIERGEKVVVTRVEATQLYVDRLTS